MARKPQVTEAVFLRKKNLTDHVVEASFRVTTPDFIFQPGQYGTIVIDEKTRRQYSFASSPQTLPNLIFVVDTSPMGPGSQWFLNLKEGENVSMIAPLGNFLLEKNEKRKVFVATGTGIVPFRAMIAGKTPLSNCALYWGLRHEGDIYWDDEFKALPGQHTGFQYFLSLSKPESGWLGLRGHVTEHVLKQETDVANTEFYLCGNRGMIEELEQKLLQKGVLRENIKKDMFY